MIEFIDVKKSLGTNDVLKGITFKVNEGEILFILGTSGTGKSVTLKSIVGLLRPDAGKIWVDKQEVSRITEEDFFPIRKKCGMVFQHPALFDSLSVYENIAFGLRKHFDYSEEEISNIIDDCLKLVNLKRDIKGLKPQDISYGMQKRVSLARTIALKPKILLFDEPTTGLDPITTNTITQLIKDLSRTLKTTSLVVSHDMHCALDIADRIIVLDKGFVAAHGTPEELKKTTHPLVKDFMAEALKYDKNN